MNKSTIVEQVAGRPHLKDYTYAVLFFLLSSFFAFFIIKPVLSIAFALNRKALDLAHINSVYEKNILNLVEIQSKMEQVRDKIYLLDDALPTNPKVSNLLGGIYRAASEQNITIQNLDIAPVNLKSTNTDIKSISVSMNVSGDFVQVNNFIKSIVFLKRLATIDSIKIIRVGQEGQEIQSLRIQMSIRGFYL